MKYYRACVMVFRCVIIIEGGGKEDPRNSPLGSVRVTECSPSIWPWFLSLWLGASGTAGGGLIRGLPRVGSFLFLKPGESSLTPFQGVRTLV